MLNLKVKRKKQNLNYVLRSLIGISLCATSGISFAECEPTENNVILGIGLGLLCNVYAETGPVMTKDYQYTLTLSDDKRWFDVDLHTNTSIRVVSGPDVKHERDKFGLLVSVNRTNTHNVDDIVILADVQFSGPKSGIMFKNVQFHIPKFVIRDNLEEYNKGSFYFRYNRYPRPADDNATFLAYWVANSNTTLKPNDKTVEIKCSESSIFKARIDTNYISDVTVPGCTSTFLESKTK